MKKFLTAALSLLLSVSAVFAFAACETSGGTGDTGGAERCSRKWRARATGGKGIGSVQAQRRRTCAAGWKASPFDALL